jgi:23S rRNA pseudouridine1911/1915/1917 synthase
MSDEHGPSDVVTTERPAGRLRQVEVPAELAGERLDRVLPLLLPEISRVIAADLISRGKVQINGRDCKPASRPIAGARIFIEVPAPPASTALAEDLPVTVVYEDETLVVVDKPAGMVVHPAPGNETGTLVNALLGRYAGLPGDPVRPGIVHRLDKDTSGLMVVARTPAAVTTLAEAFKNRRVHKEYVALLIGKLDQPTGKIQSEIGRDPRHRQRMAVVGTGGRDAQTTYWTSETFAQYTLVRVRLDTGRMHQIRVHFSALGHPVAGDPVYGRATRGTLLKRQFLHAALLRFVHPRTGEELTFESPLPEDLASFLVRLREAAAGAATR